jgi:hydrophobic/amphiphilic exporter-1 (mainly G- bacteria), HAE1 family
MWLTRASLRNPITVTLLCFLVLVSGAAAFLAMGRSILPPVSFPIVTVTAPYAGAGTEEMERLVVRPIEDELEGVPQLERVSSYAQAGVANIVVRFRFGSSIETDRSNVQQAVESARANMPPDLVPPVVATEDPSQIPVLTESLTSAVLSPRELSEIVDRTIAPALRAAPAIGSVVVSGDRTRQFTVVPDLGALDALGLSVLDINRSLAGANDVLPGGVLRSSTAEANVGVRSASENAEDLRRLPVAMELANVRLGDLARVVDGRAQETIVSRVDGAPAVVVFVSRAENADALGAIAGAQRLFTNLARRYPLIRFETLRTEAPYTTAAIGGVLQSLGEGVVLTVLVMVLFLHAWRNALISAIAIPVSLCAAFVAMWIAGFTIDVLSLMGLSLTIGILVDDSIVIIEAIVRSAARGLKDDDAALAGRSELGGAAFAITLVDVAVFAPIAFMGGVIGEFMREFGLTIVFATAFSLVVAYTLTPLLAARWALPRSAVPFAGWQTLPWMLRGRTVRAAIEAWHRGLARFSQMEERVAESYAMRWLPEAAKRRRLVLCGALIVSSVAFIPAFDGGIATEFSPPVDRGEAVIDLQYPPGTPLGRSDRETNALAGTLLEDPAIAHVAAVSGRGFNGSTDVVASNLAQLVVVLADPLASGDATIERVKALAGVVPDARIAGSGRGMGGSAPITYTIAGEAGAADEAASRLAETLESDRNATDVRISNAGISPRVEIDVDPSKAMTLGVAADDAAQTARIATGGAIAAKVRLRTGLANVVLQSDAAEHGDLDDALRVEVRDRSGRLVPLADVVDVRRSLAPTVIEREDGRRVVTVTANPKAGEPIGAVTAPLARALRKPGFLPDGASVAPRGDIEQLLETMRKMLTALALALVVVYGILAVLYRSYRLPVVIMATVPLAAAGALGALFVSREPLNLYSMLGIVMLVGLVAKNGILLVEYAERAVRAGATAAMAMQHAARRRFRPIVMTTFAMIAGMLPLALGRTAGAEYRQALGTVVIGGLCSSLFLTLFVVPLVYTRFRRTAEIGVAPTTSG